MPRDGPPVLPSPVGLRHTAVPRRSPVVRPPPLPVGHGLDSTDSVSGASTGSSQLCRSRRVCGVVPGPAVHRMNAGPRAGNPVLPRHAGVEGWGGRAGADTHIPHLCGWSICTRGPDPDGAPNSQRVGRAGAAFRARAAGRTRSAFGVASVCVTVASHPVDCEGPAFVPHERAAAVWLRLRPHACVSLSAGPSPGKGHTGGCPHSLAHQLPSPLCLPVRLTNRILSPNPCTPCPPVCPPSPVYVHVLCACLRQGDERV
mmetsp:Transcript_38338/g.68506  ORF Transcript_38338/g.68506 Transcript_38338/m.68506 type:complete len:258 (+) Transcript_38338:171-944(+)